MANAKYTPGPWAVDCVVSDDHRDHDIVLGYEIPGAGDPVLVASVYFDDRPPGIDRKQADANARLIARAPALAEAIRDQIAWIERLLRQLEHRDVVDTRGNVVNGFAAAVVPDWELRQKLESLKEDLASTEGRDG